MTDAYDITWASGSTVAGRRKNNWAASVAPGSTDDEDKGYEPGSSWLDVVGHKTYVCETAGAGTATWVSASGSDSYQHIQGSASVTWTVIHNLGRYPAVTALDSGGTEFECDVDHSSINQVVLTLASALSGTATCS